LEKRYVGKLSKKALNIMKAMLTMDPNDRITALEALADTYFDGIRDPDIEKLIKEQLGTNANTHGS
jgi:cyclin-dependent kinase-like